MTRKPRRFFQPAPANRAGDAEWGPGEVDPAEAIQAETTGLEDFDPDALERGELVDRRQIPSLPIILFSAASGVAGGVIALFISYRWLQWSIELSAGIATLALLFSLGISGAILSSAMGSRSAPVNILFSCGVILLAFFSLLFVYWWALSLAPF